MCVVRYRDSVVLTLIST